MPSASPSASSRIDLPAPVSLNPKITVNGAQIVPGFEDRISTLSWPPGRGGFRISRTAGRRFWLWRTAGSDERQAGKVAHQLLALLRQRVYAVEGRRPSRFARRPGATGGGRARSAARQPVDGRPPGSGGGSRLGVGRRGDGRDLHHAAPDELVLDVAWPRTVFHGYYDCYCFLPPMCSAAISCGELSAAFEHRRRQTCLGDIEELLVTRLGKLGPMSASSCARIRASAATRCCPGASVARSVTSSAWPRTRGSTIWPRRGWRRRRGASPRAARSS